MSGYSKWYVPGDWSLPKWWTDGPVARGNGRLTHAEQVTFYSSPFVRNVLQHSGGITSLPTMIKCAKCHKEQPLESYYKVNKTTCKKCICSRQRDKYSGPISLNAALLNGWKRGEQL